VLAFDSTVLGADTWATADREDIAASMDKHARIAIAANFLKHLIPISFLQCTGSLKQVVSFTINNIY
jgi:hypothetical protein